MTCSVELERKLVDLRAREPALAAALERENGSVVEVVTGPRGSRTLRERGVLLGSAYDPVAEGRRLAEEMDASPADVLVAIGAGLGYQLEAYRERCPVPVVVYEPSLERLRAALAARPDAACFALDDVVWTWDLDSLERGFRGRYEPGAKVTVFVHPAVRALDPEGVQTALRTISRLKDAGDINTRTIVAMSAEWAMLTAHNTRALLRTPNASLLAGVFAGRPAVVAAAGPSLDRQLPLLARYAGRVGVVAIGQSLAALRAADIEPDLVHLVESQNVAHQLECAGKVKDEVLALCPSAHPDLFALPVRARFSIYPTTNSLGRWIATSQGEEEWMGGGSTVAQSAVRLAAAMGANPVILIGQDLAFTDGRVYASGSAYDLVSVHERSDGTLVYANLDRKAALSGRRAAAEQPVELVHVEGWSGGRVATSKGYATFLTQYADIALDLAERGTEIVNCTEGGARIPGLRQACFADELASVPEQRIDFRREILRRHDAAPPADEEALARALDDARRGLRTLERTSRAGRAHCARARRRRPHSAALLRDLRAVSRNEQRLKRELEALPWFDDLVVRDVVQEQLGELRSRVECAPEEGPEHEQALLQARALFRAAARGVPLARALVDQMQQQLSQADRA